MSIPFIDSQILSTLELLHYCRRFEGKLFSFCFFCPDDCGALLMDIRSLHAARIKQVVVAPYQPQLEQQFELWREAGDNFEVIRALNNSFLNQDLYAQLNFMVGRGVVPVILVENVEASIAGQLELYREVFQLSSSLGAKKLFFPTSEEGLFIDDRFHSYPSNEKVRQLMSEGGSSNIPAEVVSLILENQEAFRLDVVLVQARRGSVYEEVFTHAGSGTLFTSEFPNELRPARRSDVRDIMAIMGPQIADRTLTPLSEEGLLSLIPHFTVYCLNEQIVAAAALIEFGDSYELSKLCTLPRYQAKGRARALVESLIERARREGKRAVFALTVQDYVGAFFERIGFACVSRESLPATWQQGYDFSRNSKAYQYLL